MLETEEAVLRVAHKLCSINIESPCQQPCSKHSAEARLAVYTILEAAANTDGVPSPEGFKAEIPVSDKIMEHVGAHRRKYKIEKLAEQDLDEEVLVEVETNMTADLLSSEGWTDNIHWPVFDLDFDAALIPSKTPGHFHLYLEKALTWQKYRRLLRAFHKAGLLNDGWYKLVIKRKKGTLFLPGRKSALIAFAEKDSYGWRRTQTVRYLNS
jgi:hypothetical protein